MQLVSKKASINKSQQEVYEFLTELQNYKRLMPDNTDKFEVEGESFVFALKGMPEIRLMIKDKKPCDKVILGAASGKLNFTLTAGIAATSATSSDLLLNFDGEFNPMMAMMVKGPLQKFIDTLSDKAAEL